MRPLPLTLSVIALVACGDDGGFQLGSAGSIAVEPGALTIVIGETARDATSLYPVYVGNTGDAPLTVRALRVERVAPSDAGEVVHATPLSLPFIVAPDAAPVRVDLAYTRRDDLARTLALVITSDDPERPVVRVPIDVVLGAPHLVAHPASLVFPRASAPAAKVVRLMNTGNASLSLTRLRLDAPLSFSAALAGVAPLAAAGTRDVTLAEPLVIEPSGHRELTLTFAPSDTLRATGKLVVFGDAPNAKDGVVIDLTGNDGGPCLLVRPPELAFGTKAEGASATMPLHLDNCGTEDVTVHALRIATSSDAADPALAALGVDGASSPRFSLLEDPALPTDGAPLVLSAGASRSFLVTYDAWTSDALGGSGARVHDDRGALIVTSSAFAPVAVVRLSAATEIEDEVVVPDVPGCEWQGGVVQRHRVAVTLTADNFYELWINGDLVATDTGHWANEDRVEVELDSGCHVIGIHAWGDGAVTAGMIAAVEIDDVVRWTSGDAKPEWSVTGPDAPAGDWHDLFYDDASWDDPRACSKTSQWGTAVDPVLGLGARWVWWNPECDDQLATAWFRLTFTVD